MFDEVADAVFPVGEVVEDGEARGVGQGVEEGGVDGGGAVVERWTADRHKTIVSLNDDIRKCCFRGVSRQCER